MIKKYTLPLFFLLILSGCTTIYNPATNRREHYLIDTKEEIRLGASLDRELQKRFTLIKDSATEKRFDSMVPRIIQVCDRQDIVYFFRIVKDDSLNAFSLPGGYVYVNTGLLKIATDDELVCVLGHEIGHITARHSIKRLQTVLGVQSLLSIALGKNNFLLSKAVDVILNLAALGYSRQDEFQADGLGIKYARKAGYDPHAMITLFKKLDAPSGKKSNLEFLRDHPSFARRIENATREINLLQYP